jgi:hypothetical protein
VPGPVVIRVFGEVDHFLVEVLLRKGVYAEHRLSDMVPRYGFPDTMVDRSSRGGSACKSSR